MNESTKLAFAEWMLNAPVANADAIVGHLGKRHKLSRLIRARRESMGRESGESAGGAPPS